MLNVMECHQVNQAIASELLTMLDQGVTVRGNQGEHDRLRRIGWGAIPADGLPTGDEEAYVQNRVSEYLNHVQEIYAQHYQATYLLNAYGEQDQRTRVAREQLKDMRDKLVELAQKGYIGD